MLDKLNQVDRARHNRRKSVKSPINIRGKIRELQIQMEKLHKIKDTYKRSPYIPHSPLHLQLTASPEHNSHRQPGMRKKPYFQSYEKRQDVKTKNERPPLIGQQLPPRQNANFKQTPESTRRFFSPQILTRRQSDNQTAKGFQQKQQGQQEKLYRNLLKQNQRYKQIYSQSVEKLHQLEGKLHKMKQEHQHENIQLESLIEQLRRKVDQKKTNNLAHIYSFEAKNNNFLVVKDKIITQTDNQNSASHLQPHKQYLASHAASFLSAQSK